MMTAPARPDPMIQIDYGRYAALIIDDHPFMREIVRNLLRDIGFGTVVSAIDGTSALDILRGEDRHFDVIVCDVDMEPMNGLEFVSELRLHDIAHLRTIPVVLLTAHADKVTVVGAMEAGTDAYLLKPVSRVNLKARIDFVLSRRT
jgi:two-component system, chemotaxis family, chemotaxis protein CheY